MTERPVLFSAPMVRAILAGTKTQTRRLVSPRVLEHIQYLTGSADGQEPTGLGQGSTPDNRLRIWSEEYPDEGCVPVDCPYGKPGDRLWVRETWAPVWKTEYPPEDPRDVNIQYRADWPNDKYPGHWPDDCGDDEACGRWKPSIHMPRWASRITLEVTSVRVERLRDISAADAVAEGAADVLLDLNHPQRAEAFARGEWTGDEELDVDGPFAGAVQAFSALWDSINVKRAPWESNPWVWVVGFQRVTP